MQLSLSQKDEKANYELYDNKQFYYQAILHHTLTWDLEFFNSGRVLLIQKNYFKNSRFRTPEGNQQTMGDAWVKT